MSQFILIQLYVVRNVTSLEFVIQAFVPFKMK